MDQHRKIRKTGLLYRDDTWAATQIGCWGSKRGVDVRQQPHNVDAAAAAWAARRPM